MQKQTTDFKKLNAELENLLFGPSPRKSLNDQLTDLLYGRRHLSLTDQFDRFARSLREVYAAVGALTVGSSRNPRKVLSKN